MTVKHQPKVRGTHSNAADGCSHRMAAALTVGTVPALAQDDAEGRAAMLQIPGVGQEPDRRRLAHGRCADARPDHGDHHRG